MAEERRADRRRDRSRAAAGRRVGQRHGELRGDREQPAEDADERAGGAGRSRRAGDRRGSGRGERDGRQERDLTVSASGSELRHQWTRNAVAIAGATASSYTTPALTLADSGAVYGVVVYNGAGAAFSAGAVLTVTPGPALSAATLVSVSTAGVVANNSSDQSSVSADGLVVAFTSTATNLVPGITVGDNHGYVRDLVTGVTTLVDQTPAGTPSSRGVLEMKLAANGRHVVFTSLADDLVAGDTNGSMDVFVRDLQTGYTTRANVLPGGVQMPSIGNGALSVHPTISANGEYVAFAYPYDLLGNGEQLPLNGVYLRDVEASSARLVVASASFYAGNPVLSDDASRIVYVYALGTQNVIGSYDVRAGTNSTLFTVDSSIPGHRRGVEPVRDRQLRRVHDPLQRLDPRLRGRVQPGRGGRPPESERADDRQHRRERHR